MRTLKLRGELVEWQLVDDEVIALDLRTSRYLGLNDTAALLWQAIAAETSDAELIDSIVQAFEVDREQATADVMAFVSDLASRGLLVINDR